MNGINGADLDRWITGNYGEDQFLGMVECPECGAMVEENGEVCACGWASPPTEPDPDEAYDRRRDAALDREDFFE